MPEPTSISTAIAAPPAMPAMCGHPGCTEPATHGYVWAWGESGVCCPLHMGTLQQTAGYLERTIQFSVLNPNASPPLERPERVRLKGEVYALEEELVEVKARGLDMYRQNTQLIQQVQSLTVRNREADAQLRDAAIALTRISAERDKLAAELGELSDEVGRLRVLVAAGDLGDVDETIPGTGPR